MLQFKFNPVYQTDESTRVNMSRDTVHPQVGGPPWRTLLPVVNASGTEATSPSPSAFSRRFGHRRNMSDIGLCPIDQRRESVSWRLTSISDRGLPRTLSRGSFELGEHSRSTSDTTCCTVHLGPY